LPALQEQAVIAHEQQLPGDFGRTQPAYPSADKLTPGRPVFLYHHGNVEIVSQGVVHDARR
jgi:predicted Rossmann fold nucleotide-binding protein DprA/Smf involved in DNA uptake